MYSQETHTNAAASTCFQPYITPRFAVLGVSLLLEGYSLLVAIRTVTAGAASQGLPFAEFVKRGMDPTSIAVMMEDGAACAGLVIAGQPHK